MFEDMPDGQIPSDFLEEAPKPRITLADIFGPMRDKEGTVTLISKEINGRKVLIYEDKAARVVGSQFRNDDGEKLMRQAIIQHLKTAMELDKESDHILELRREPDNPYDRNAIGVFFEPEGVTPSFARPMGRIGFLPKELAAALAERIDSGEFKPFAKVNNLKLNRQGVLYVDAFIFEYQ